MSDPKEWTLMFYMASDNPLAISIVSQLKAIKSAGFHHDVNVVAQFDPYAQGTPTHIFDVNVINKQTKPDKYKIGFDDDNKSLEQNLIDDRLWRDEVDRRGTLIRVALNDLMVKKKGVQYTAPEAPPMFLNGTNGHNGGSPEVVTVAHGQPENGQRNGTTYRRSREPGPYQSLQTFLKFSREFYPAKHYMLFILGHGVVVGNDIFLYDAHAEENSITLVNMGKALRDFKKELDVKGATFELVSFNSCSVSSLEVAYELKDTANYMLASQGPTFVGSWPYREILIRVFKELTENKNDIRQLISDIYKYCLDNSTDFLLAGYSYQLTLCDLRKVTDLNDAMQNLSRALITALSPTDPDANDAASTFVILYAHWKSQSFFEEMYTDLYDFCFCIVDRCQRLEDAENPIPWQLQDIRTACVQVMEILAKPDVEAGKRPGKISDKAIVVTASDFVGPAYQYSRGMSVYFPWGRPSEDTEIMQEYRTYKFHDDFKQKAQRSWLDFLEAYFKMTQRDPKRDEIRFQQERLEKIQQEQPEKKKTGMPIHEKGVLVRGGELELREDIGSLIYNGEGVLGGFALSKTDPRDKLGNDCNCPSFKNYPRDTRARGNRKRPAQELPGIGTILGPLVAQSE